MKVLIIEDDKEHIQKYSNCVATLLYSVELEAANGIKQALKLVETVQPDVILLDLELNESDGDGVLFLEKLNEMKLKVVPYIIIITNNRSHRTHYVVRSFGADYVFTKAKPDYSPRLVLDFAYKYFNNQSKPTKVQASLEDIITREIEKIGFTSDMCGKYFLADAVITAIYSNKNNPSLKKEIYPVVARKYKKMDWSVDRGIRNAIIKTWRITDIDTLQENYTSNVDYGTGYPTNKEMILYLAEKIKREYAGYI